jgi:hypothetical protein
MGKRDTPRAENQKLFRLGNERLLTAVLARTPDTDLVPFLCECADAFCDGRVELRSTIGKESHDSHGTTSC